MDKNGGVYKKMQGRRTTPMVQQLKHTVSITHPFHPFYLKQFGLVGYRRSWGHECVDLHDEHEQIVTVPISWTDAAPPDPFVTISAGRSAFCPDDLIRLVHLLDGLGGSDKG